MKLRLLDRAENAPTQRNASVLMHPHVQPHPKPLSLSAFPLLGLAPPKGTFGLLRHILPVIRRRLSAHGLPRNARGG